MKVVRPIKFDKARRSRRNAKRRGLARLKRDAESALRRSDRMIWVGCEPEVMWLATDFGNEGDNDNEATKNARR